MNQLPRKNQIQPVNCRNVLGVGVTTRVGLTDVGKYKISDEKDIDNNFRDAITRAYQKAEKYLQRGK